jgi:phenylpyruvate tautomerase PptA (4-oxalocrotonate tautomerase family)
MPLMNVKGIEGVFTPERRTQIAERLTDAMVSVEVRTCVRSPGV